MQVYHNTCFQQGDIVGDLPLTKNFVFRGNITNSGRLWYELYGPRGIEPLLAAAEEMNNSIIDTRTERSARSSNYSSNNYYPSTINEVGFIDRSSGRELSSLEQQPIQE